MCRKWTKIFSKYNIRECRDISRQQGSLTLEASIFLSLFILFFVMLMSLVQISKAQVILQYSINEVAKDVSACSYILTKTGIVSKRVSTSETANEFVDKTTSMVDSILQVGNTVFEGGDIVGDIQNAAGQVQEYFSDPDDLLNKILSLVKQQGASIVANAIIGEIVEGEVEKQIDVMSYKGAEQYLKDMGIVDGLDGLDFSKTKWCEKSSGGMPELEIVVTYSMDFDLGIIELEPRNFKLCAKTALW